MPHLREERMEQIDKASEIRDYLNTVVEDPLSTERRGVQFYTLEDDFNFNRGDTFPKGAITFEEPDTETKALGSEVVQKENDLVTVWYYVRSGDKYTRPDNSNVVSNAGLCSYMMGKIKQALARDNRQYITFGAIHNPRFGQKPAPITTPNSKFTLYEGSVVFEIVSVYKP